MTMSLARKYRPKKLADLAGQETLLRVLGAAISNNKIGQAYVLTGIRGVGKTSTARIIARAINCQNGPTLDPCGICASCVAIDNDNALDVIEIDAASNNGVDYIRELVANVGYAPMQAKSWKIYIIDEAHSLSKNAWDGLLKTLEEPPEHVIFIFATTEARKIPGTILSRSQTLTLKRIALDVITQRILWVAQQEGFIIENSAANLIARAAEGSMRDGLSILDTAVSAQPNGITADGVMELLGRADRMTMGQLAGSVIDGDTVAVSKAWSNFYVAGQDPLIIIEDLTTWIHNAHMCQIAPDYIKSLSLPKEEVDLLNTLSKKAVGAALQGCSHYLLEASVQAKSSTSQSLAVEMALMRATSRFASLKNKG